MRKERTRLIELFIVSDLNEKCNHCSIESMTVFSALINERKLVLKLAVSFLLRGRVENRGVIASTGADDGIRSGLIPRSQRSCYDCLPLLQSGGKAFKTGLISPPVAQ